MIKPKENMNQQFTTKRITKKKKSFDLSLKVPETITKYITIKEIANSEPVVWWFWERR